MSSEKQNLIDDLEEIHIEDGLYISKKVKQSANETTLSNKVLAEKYKAKVAMQSKQISLDLPIGSRDVAGQKVPFSRQSRMQKHARNMSAITSKSPKRCIRRDNRFILSSVNEAILQQNMTCNNSNSEMRTLNQSQIF